MPDVEQPELFAATESDSVAPTELLVTLDIPDGCVRFEWSRAGTTQALARGWLRPALPAPFRSDLEWTLELNSNTTKDGCDFWPSSIRALLNRVQKLLPVTDSAVRLAVLPDFDLGPFKNGVVGLYHPPARESGWKLIARYAQKFADALRVQRDSAAGTSQNGRDALRKIIEPEVRYTLRLRQPELFRASGTSIKLTSPSFHLRVTFETIQGFTRFDWTDPHTNAMAASGHIRCSGLSELTWILTVGGREETLRSSHHLGSIRATLRRWRRRFPVNDQAVTVCWVRHQEGTRKIITAQGAPFQPEADPWSELEEHVQEMARALRSQFSPLNKLMAEIDPLNIAELERDNRRQHKIEQKRVKQEQRLRENIARAAEERQRRTQDADAARKTAEARKRAETSTAPAQISAKRSPVPPVPIRIDPPPLTFQETAFPLENLRSYFLRERAALWWVSNQSDDLLCLPHCQIQRLDYQIRSALRVLGPLRGRALLSDEVGLGKTIEAGLVLKELLTRGMIKRFLVLTVPSLVDQWEEELADKFNLPTVTTNHEGVRADLEKFWRENSAIVASLHTLKLPAHLAIARQVAWDLLIVDEAHYLRNRESQAWQAVNALPRQFLLLLTATPVQNSLDELYNLVTLLQPGQLPTPKEFRARFIDPKRPRQPKEPEELRRLLGQVMIRNTRANAGLHLPPRHAETALFEPDQAEGAFWTEWETQLRAALAKLPSNQSSLWGRLLLQTAGSSPAAWRGALEKFPEAMARGWRERAPLEGSWTRKCHLLPPIIRHEGGAVIFTQFLLTQAALAESLRDAGLEVFVINGGTPPERRQPITEDFRRRGGALLLTHSGTEGRNLQFCHRLVNFDLPWNPMEIEQRIGRLHRLGQQQPVRIYNLVQAGTLQEHLLQILQEKLNLFELVVGETGLILGEKFSSDEFAEEVLRRWRESEGRVAQAMQSLGDELAVARENYAQVKQLDETLFAKDYESL